jgi:hypothetical protein
MKEESKEPQQRSRSKALLILTSIYGLLYVMFIVSGSNGSSGSEPIVVNILFALFLVGYAAVWKNEGLGGLIFVLWWIGMWYLGFFVAQHDRGAAVVLGFPLFVLALLLIRSWYRKRSARVLTGLADLVKRAPILDMAFDQVNLMMQGFLVDGSKAERELGLKYTPLRVGVEEAIASFTGEHHFRGSRPA